MSNQPNYEQDHSHRHCWESENPPCGMKGKHRCCLCQKEVPQPTIESVIRERVRIMREESGIEISPACEQIILREVQLAISEERTRCIEIVEKTPKEEWDIAWSCDCDDHVSKKHIIKAINNN